MTVEDRRMAAARAGEYAHVDLAPLRSYWHPVASSSAVGDAPVGVTLLEEDLVLFRSGDRVAAFADLCPHRGTRLSLGSVTADGCLQCPYHGWQYDVDGRCVFIPSQPKDHQRIPSKARAVQYRAEERYGLVWVALAEPRRPIPEYPEFDDPGFHTWMKFCGQRQTGAARFAENALDLAHLDFVHPGLLGDPGDAVIEPYEVKSRKGAVVMRYRKSAVGPETFASGPGEVRHEVTIDLPYTFTLRFATEIGRTVILGAHQPITRDSCALWRFESRNHALEQSDDEFIAFLDRLLPQDQAIIESQRPPMVPLELSEELHTKIADAGSVEYRRAMRQDTGMSYC